MPTFDLRGIKVAKYQYTQNIGVSYTSKTSVGDAMDVNLEFRHAEARLYAESSLAEYMRKATGGSISIAVKYIKQEAQKPGMEDISVISLQQLLTAKGYYEEDWDGVYGELTKRSVMAFQADNNLETDGEVGGQTWGKLLKG